MKKFQGLIEISKPNDRKSFTVSPLQVSGTPTQYFNSPHYGSATPLKSPSPGFTHSERLIHLGSNTPQNQGDNNSDKSDEEENTIAAQNFITFFRDFRLKRKLNAFLQDLPSRRYKRLTKRQHTIIKDNTSHYKVSRQMLLEHNTQSAIYYQTSKVTDSSNLQIKYHHQSPIGLLQENVLKRLHSTSRRVYDYCTKTLMHKCRLNKILHKIPLFDYQSNKKLCCDVLYCISSLMFYFSIPLHVSFNQRISEFVAQPILITSWLVILMHIIVTLNTCYYEKGLLVNSRSKILHHYMQKDLFSELFSFVPLTIIMGREVNQNQYGGDDPVQIILSFLFIYKIYQFQKVIIGIEERFHMSNRINYFIQLWRYDYANYKKSWLETRGVQEETWQVQYLYGFYFITVTMISVGYGDIVPQSNIEIILCIVIMFISCFVFAYSVNMIGEIINNIYMQDNIVKQQIRIIGGFMAKNNINQNLRQQIRIYLEYYQRQFSEQNEREEQKIISHLSDNLKNSLMIEANKFILRDSPIFSKYFSEGVIEKMVSIIKEYRCTPEQIIFQRNNIDKEDAKIYFIKSGLVEIYGSRTANRSSQNHLMQKTPIKVLKLGDSFGEYQFFTGNSNTYSARSLEFSRILYISRKDFLEILKQYPVDYEKFCYIKDKITFQKDASNIQLKCYICDSQRHLIEDCNITHFVEDTYKIIKKQQYLVPVQERQKFCRNDFKQPWHSKIEEIRENAWQLQDDNESYIENVSWMSWDSDSYIPSDDDRYFNFQDDNINSSQKLMMIQRNEYENMNDRKQSDSFREHRKAMNQRQFNIEQNTSQGNTPPDGRRNPRISTPMMAQRQLFLMRQSQMISKINFQQDKKYILNLKDQQQGLQNKNNDDQQQLPYERKETNQSKKMKISQRQSNQEQLFTGSPLCSTPNAKSNLNSEFFVNQKKLLKLTGKELGFQRSETVRSSQSDATVSAQNSGGVKQNIKLSVFNNLGLTTISPSHQNQINNNNVNPQQLMIQQQQQLQQQITQHQSNLSTQGGFTQVLTNLQTTAASQKKLTTTQTNQGNNNAISIAEMIGKQLMMNNKNNYMGKMNEENTFDVRKTYEFYYKHNNYLIVLKKYNKPILGRIKLLQKNRLKKRKDQSLVRQNSKHHSLIQSNHSLYQNSITPRAQQQQSSMKKSNFKDQRNDSIITDSVIQQSVFQKSDKKAAKLSQDQFLTVNIGSQIKNLQSLNNTLEVDNKISNLSIVPFSPQSSNVSIQILNNQKSFVGLNAHQTEKILDDNSMVSFINNNNNNNNNNNKQQQYTDQKNSQYTQNCETIQINSTQNNEPLLTNNNYDTQDRLTNQIEIFKQKIKQTKVIENNSKQNEQILEIEDIQSPTRVSRQQQNLQNIFNQPTQNKDPYPPQQLIGSGRQQAIFSPQEQSCATSPLLKKDSSPRKQGNRDIYMKNRHFNFQTIEEKTSENINTQILMNQDSEETSQLKIKQISDKPRMQIQDCIGSNSNADNLKIQIAKIIEYQENTNNNDFNNLKSYKIHDDPTSSQQNYLKLDFVQDIPQSQRDNIQGNSPKKNSRASIQQKEFNQKTFQKTPSIEKNLIKQTTLAEKQRKSKQSGQNIEEKGFSRLTTLNPNNLQPFGQGYQDLKKLSIRRYSRAYNMALFKRQSTKTNIGQDQPLNNDEIKKGSQVQININVKHQKTINTSSCSSSSSSTISNIYQPFTSQQITKFKFEMD